MKYIFKDELLNFDRNKITNMQYYQWSEKQRIQKEKKQYQKLQKMWLQIEQEEKEQEKNKKTVRHYFPDSRVKPEQIYQKNLMWKQTVDDKVQKLRQEQIQEQEEKQQRAMIIQKRQTKCLFKEEKHKGPIKAWKERFSDYLKGKSRQNYQTQNSFKPQINDNSRRITSKMVGKVEDRLIDYGQRLKEKKAQLEAEYDQQFEVNKVNSNMSIDSNLSDVYWRLYKDGERINQRKNQNTSEFSFTPVINHLSEQLASRVAQKRKPLYESKMPEKESKQENKVKKNQKGFQDFIRRNQDLLHKISNHKFQKIEMLKEKQNLIQKECTFAPLLNQKSKKILQNLKAKQQPAQISAQLSRYEQENKKIAKNSFQFCSKQGSSTQRMHGFQPQKRFQQISHLYRDDSSILHNKEQFDELDGQAATLRKREEEESIVNYKGLWEIEEDSIERGKEEDWERELMRMQQHIQNMISRTPID